MLLILIVIA